MPTLHYPPRRNMSSSRCSLEGSELQCAAEPCRSPSQLPSPDEPKSYSRDILVSRPAVSVRRLFRKLRLQQASKTRDCGDSESPWQLNCPRFSRRLCQYRVRILILSRKEKSTLLPNHYDEIQSTMLNLGRHRPTSSTETLPVIGNCLCSN
ncbi:hypothetical protein BDP81DRAFT_221824 [Colletotrichum phormii]|uniref:Uncharacterized protein n=1 Tax=Colletotrichum phormii TaxID=359342 RepID=A0AAI9ZSB0_9PEZI|nr:uncharacterized protein BDP81DRAFT_221824 [Colletotrichum phormii]KAK1637287.1 hypothetical protein BDP81DRAFT_221824 [Colletotrichum phormii]